MQITDYIEKLIKGVDLSFDEAGELLDIILDGNISEAQTAAFLAVMQAKGPTADELAGLAGALRKHAVPVKVKTTNLIDTCGTGAAAVKTFNVSTAAAFVAAGAGAFVAKHGNRAITSNCGSADVLAELGVKIDCGAGLVAQCIEQAGVGFMFAPMFHPAMKYVQPVRKALGIRTVFNFLGPLANPARANGQVLGVADKSLMKLMAQTLNKLGTKRAMVVHSDGLDEIGIAEATDIIELNNGQFSEYKIEPSDFGISCNDIEQIKGTDTKHNAKIVKDVISGKEKGASADIVKINAAAAIIVSGIAEDFRSGLKLAGNAIESGRAADAMDKMIEISNR